ncbi:hypothetical protein MCHI_003044 [Candidatus Magnetoovum chiemensis]|nr:hypothetical protein MCHI_003044 [Candidatus Magnetoovum chiemensis]
MNSDYLKYFTDLYSNPLFKNAFTEFLLKMQKEGLDSARKFGDMSAKKDNLYGGYGDIFEKMLDFYNEMGFVSRKKYDEVVKENEGLKKENAFLKDTLSKLNLRVFEEGGKNIQEAWKETVDKQIEASKEITKSFIDIFKDFGKK